MLPKKNGNGKFFGYRQSSYSASLNSVVIVMSRHVHKASTQIGTGALPPNWAPINFSTNISSLIGSLPIGFHSANKMSDEIIVAEAFCILHFNVKSGVSGKGFLASGKGKGN